MNHGPIGEGRFGGGWRPPGGSWRSTYRGRLFPNLRRTLTASPPAGTTNREWHARLARALGNASDAFVRVSGEMIVARPMKLVGGKQASRKARSYGAAPPPNDPPSPPFTLEVCSD